MPGQLNAHAPAGVSRREVKRWQARQWGGSLNPVDVWELLGIQQDTGTVVTLFGNMRAGGRTYTYHIDCDSEYSIIGKLGSADVGTRISRAGGRQFRRLAGSSLQGRQQDAF